MFQTDCSALLPFLTQLHVLNFLRTNLTKMVTGRKTGETRGTQDGISVNPLYIESTLPLGLSVSSLWDCRTSCFSSMCTWAGPIIFARSFFSWTLNSRKTRLNKLKVQWEKIYQASENDGGHDGGHFQLLLFVNFNFSGSWWNAWWCDWSYAMS